MIDITKIFYVTYVVYKYTIYQFFPVDSIMLTNFLITKGRFSWAKKFVTRRPDRKCFIIYKKNTIIFRWNKYWINNVYYIYLTLILCLERQLVNSLLIYCTIAQDFFFISYYVMDIRYVLYVNSGFFAPVFIFILCTVFWYKVNRIAKFFFKKNVVCIR